MSVGCLDNLDVRNSVDNGGYGAIRTGSITGQFTKTANQVLGLV